MPNGGVSDEFIQALHDYHEGRTTPTGGDVELFRDWLGQDPPHAAADHDDEIALAPALLGQLLVCPMAAIPTDRQPSVADADDEWFLVDKRALVGPEDWR
ncbi:hypothetical protein [Halosimplex pelagicum]|uniref:Uncharacterized protein n=1 Tax=Halosimplex pelagicum TaxID=869886 RepID=A0A7D5TA45_9EURY|nr:hypothetical protein [Halosimplex pelagicum]QLH81013.1 hypothetical protein HZS54_04895 [Halosimplex pelagicum]